MIKIVFTKVTNLETGKYWYTMNPNTIISFIEVVVEMNIVSNFEEFRIPSESYKIELVAMTPEEKKNIPNNLWGEQD